MIWNIGNTLAPGSFRGILLSLVLFAPATHAATWICGDGNWNWNGSPLSCWDWWDYPDSGEDVWIVDTVLYKAKTVTYVNPGYNPALKNLYINSNSDTATRVYQAQDRLTATNEQIGADGKGTFEQAGGKHTVTDALYLGHLPGSTGHYDLTGPGELSTGITYVGYGGDGFFIQSDHGSSHDVTNGLILAYQGDVSRYSAYTLHAGDVRTGDTYVGYWGRARFYHSGGNHFVSNTIYLAYEAGSSGFYRIEKDSPDASLVVSNDLYVGHSGAGTFRLSSGVTEVTGTVYVGFNPDSGGMVTQTAGAITAAALQVGSTSGANGRYSLWGGSLSVTDEIIHSSGSFDQHAGTHSVSGGLVVHGGGLYELEDGVLNADNEVIYRLGVGTAKFVQSGGENHVLRTTQADGNLYIGQLSTLGAGSGEYELKSGKLIVENYERIGNSSRGLLTQTGGSNTAASLYLGVNTSGKGTYNLSEGDLSALVEVVGSEGTGTFTQSGGTHSINLDMYVGAFAGTGTFDIQGGALEVGDTLTVGTNGSMEISGGVVKADTVDLSVADTFDFLGGRLQANTISGSLVNTGGTLVPGFSPGLLTVDGNYTQLVDGALEIELGGTARGTEHDAMIVTGALDLDGTLQLIWWDSFTPSTGDSFDILDWGTRSGSFNSLSLPGLPPGLAWDTSNLYVDGTLEVVVEELIFADGFE